MGVPVSMDTNDIESFDSKFTNDETKKLLKNFKNLDRDNDGFLSKDEFLQIEQLQQNPMVSRVLEIFDDDNNDKIDFSEFINALYVFTSTNEPQSQARLKCYVNNILYCVIFILLYCYVILYILYVYIYSCI